MNYFKLNESVLVEYMGDQSVVLIPGRTNTVRLSSEHTQLLKSIEAGVTTRPDPELVDALVSMGIVDRLGRPSRRDTIRLAVVATGAGAMALALPTAAAASSGYSGTLPFSFRVGARSVSGSTGRISVVAQDEDENDLNDIVIPLGTTGVFASSDPPVDIPVTVTGRNEFMSDIDISSDTEAWGPSRARTLTFTLGSRQYIVDISVT